VLIVGGFPMFGFLSKKTKKKQKKNKKKDVDRVIGDWSVVHPPPH
jgi:hypothetical protein